MFLLIPVHPVDLDKKDHLLLSVSFLRTINISYRNHILPPVRCRACIHATASSPFQTPIPQRSHSQRHDCSPTASHSSAKQRRACETRCLCLRERVDIGHYRSARRRLQPSTSTRLFSVIGDDRLHSNLHHHHPPLLLFCISIDHFSGPNTAIGRACASLCVPTTTLGLFLKTYRDLTAVMGRIR